MTSKGCTVASNTHTHSLRHTQVKTYARNLKNTTTITWRLERMYGGKLNHTHTEGERRNDPLYFLNLLTSLPTSYNQTENNSGK